MSQAIISAEAKERIQQESLSLLLKEGGLMLRKILLIQKDPCDKWTSNYEVPYIMKKVFSDGALFLTTMDEAKLPRLVNSDAVKKYYA